MELLVLIDTSHPIFVGPQGVIAEFIVLSCAICFHYGKEINVDPFMHQLSSIRSAMILVLM